MDIEDKLKLLKKEREARSKSRIIQDTWKDLSGEEELSVKERLERLINLTRTERKPPSRTIPFEPERREPFRVFENSYALNTKYGKVDISFGPQIGGDVLYFLSREEAFKDLDLSTSIFIDLETTGLSGGAGVVPFLIGMGYYKDGRFHVIQFFLGDLAEEERMIRELSDFFSRMNFRSVISYNGKGFDLPILETRFILQRLPFALAGMPHLDFLFSARTLWKHKHESCRLCHLAREVVEADRSEDIPSAEVPVRYFEYLRTGDFSLIEPILYHNQEDILSLLGLVITGSMLFSGGMEVLPEETVSDAMDLFGVAKIFEHAGEVEKSVLLFERALGGKLSSDTALLAKKKLSLYFKKNRDWGKAVSLWKDMVVLNQLFCFRELAMHYEHREKQYEEALRIAEEGLALSLDVSSAYYRKDFAHRLVRLKEKIRRRGAKEAGK